VGVAEAKLDTSVVLSHGIWTGMLSWPGCELYCAYSAHNNIIIMEVYMGEKLIQQLFMNNIKCVFYMSMQIPVRLNSVW
jgi:hypothetical protein